MKEVRKKERNGLAAILPKLHGSGYSRAPGGHWWASRAPPGLTVGRPRAAGEDSEKEEEEEEMF